LPLCGGSSVLGHQEETEEAGRLRSMALAVQLIAGEESPLGRAIRDGSDAAGLP
jgi:hypothetical protein